MGPRSSSVSPSCCRCRVRPRFRTSSAGPPVYPHRQFTRLQDQQQASLRGALQLFHSARAHRQDALDRGLCRNRGAQTVFALRGKSRQRRALSQSARYRCGQGHSAMRAQPGGFDLYAAQRPADCRHAQPSRVSLLFRRQLPRHCGELGLQLAAGDGGTAGRRLHLPRRLHLQQVSGRCIVVRRVS